jgi:hypothetical protein
MTKTEEKRRAMELVVKAITGRPPRDATPWEFRPGVALLKSMSFSSLGFP